MREAAQQIAGAAMAQASGPRRRRTIADADTLRCRHRPRPGRRRVSAMVEAEDDRAWSPWTIMLLVACWAALRPFRGIVHDAILYTGQAILHLDPASLRQDIAFASGTQDRFSLFSFAYAPLLDVFGVGTGHLIMAVAGQIAWFGALLVLVRRLFGPTHLALLAAAAVIILPPFYGSQRIFSFAEPFATARPWAEALVLLALAASIASPGQPRVRPALRAALAGACLMLALLTHPLMALPGVAVAGLLWCRAWPWLWWVATAGFAIAVGCALVGIEPFVRVLQVYDPEWFGIVGVRSAYLLLGQWSMRDWAQIAAQVALILLARPRVEEEVRRLFDAVVIVGLAGLALTAIGGDIAANILIVNVQLWRALWLVTLVAGVGAAVLLWRLPSGSVTRPLLLGALCCLLLERLALAPHLLSPVLFIGALAAQPLAGRLGPLADRVLVYLARLAASVLVLGCGAILGYAGFLLREEPAFEAWLGSIVVVLLATGLLIARPRLPRGGSVLPIGAAFALGMSLLTLDRRDPWDAFAENDDRRADVTAFIGTDGLAYWEGGFSLLWFKLRRPAGYGCYHGAGSAFFRGMAIAARDRAAAIAPLNTSDLRLSPDEICPAREDPSRTGPADAAALAGVCRALPELDVIILGEAVRGVEGSTWQPPVPVLLPATKGAPPRRIEAFHRYDCRTLR